MDQSTKPWEINEIFTLPFLELKYLLPETGKLPIPGGKK